MKTITLSIIAVFFIGSSLIAQEISKKYYETGELESIGPLNEEGYRTGEYKFYYKSGNIKGTGRLYEGVESGLWKHYYENGQLESTGKRYNRIPSGKWEYYYENGQLKRIGSLESGYLVGEWKYYHDNGQLESIGNYAYRSGKDGEWKYYDRDNNLIKTEIWVDGNIQY